MNPQERVREIMKEVLEDEALLSLDPKALFSGIAALLMSEMRTEIQEVGEGVDPRAAKGLTFGQALEAMKMGGTVRSESSDITRLIDIVHAEHGMIYVQGVLAEDWEIVRPNEA